MAAPFRFKHDVSALTKAEVQLLDVMSGGATIPQAAAALGIGRKSADNRLRDIRDKLFAKNTTEAIALWRERQTQAAA